MKKIIVLALSLAMVAAMTACSEPESKAPEDFSFSLVWGINGISSYDSATGQLVKTSDATHPEDYITHVQLDDGQADVFYHKLIEEMKAFDYPDKYDPYAKDEHNWTIMTEPNKDIELTVTCNGKTKTIRCEGVPLVSGTDYCPNKASRRFIGTINEITDYFESTAEWGALPEYEFFYE